MYLSLLLVERKVAEFYHNMDRRGYLVWLKWIIFVTIWREVLVSLALVHYFKCQIGKSQNCSSPKTTKNETS